MTDIKAHIKQIHANLGLINHLTNNKKNHILSAFVQNLENNVDKVLEASQKDILQAQEASLAPNLIDRLTLNKQRVNGLIESVKQIISLQDPINIELKSWHNPVNNLTIKRVSTPIGLIGMIFEARPNVAVDALCLCLKSSNACVLKCGTESLNSVRILTNLFKQSLPRELSDFYYLIDSDQADQTVESMKKKLRQHTSQMLEMHECIDLIIPRGSKKLVEFIQNHSKIPVLKHLDGNCHTYIHKDADINKAIDVLINAKMRRTSICSATETLLIDESISHIYLPTIFQKLHDLECKILGCETSCTISNFASPATEEDYYTEFLDATISVKVVKDYKDAVEHINKYSSSHTDAILTEDTDIANYFLNSVNSSVVMHNTSTQFCDGFEFGFGAEIGISTNKIHARGPVGLEGLTTYKYIVSSDYAKRK